VTAGSRLEDLLRAANAIGAAVDALISWFGLVEPGKMEKAAALEAMWSKYVGGRTGDFVTPIVGYLEVEARNYIRLSSNHILSGDTTARAAENAPQDIGLQFRMGDIF
jgi:hypothetical protein